MKENKSENRFADRGKKCGVGSTSVQRRPIDKIFVLDGCQDGPVRTIVREAKKHET